MKSKIVSCILVLFLSFSLGCYSSEMVTKKTLRDRVDQADLTAYTGDSLKHEFPRDHYTVQGDTLAGDSVAIPFVKITSIELREFDAPLTVLVAGGAVLIGALAMEIVPAWNITTSKWRLKW